MASKIDSRSTKKIICPPLNSYYYKRVPKSIVAATIFFQSIARSTSFVRFAEQRRVTRGVHDKANLHRFSHFLDILPISPTLLSAQTCSYSFLSRRYFPNRLLTTTSMTSTTNEEEAGFVAENLGTYLYRN